jgi:hypothetical protein
MRADSFSPNIRLRDVYGPETLKMIHEVFDDLLRSTIVERGAVFDDSALRQQLAEILLTLHSKGEANPDELRRKSLESFRTLQKCS